MEHHCKNPSGHMGTRNSFSHDVRINIGRMGKKAVLLSSGLDESFFGVHDGLESRPWHIC